MGQCWIWKKKWTIKHDHMFGITSKIIARNTNIYFPTLLKISVNFK